MIKYNGIFSAILSSIQICRTKKSQISLKVQIACQDKYLTTLNRFFSTEIYQITGLSAKALFSTAQK
jgi:hypothetical protein